jgi:hypothetical protein
MEKRTLKFNCLIQLATFSKSISVGYLMNTNNYTLTGRFPEKEVQRALTHHNATLIETNDKVFSYETIV